MNWFRSMALLAVAGALRGGPSPGFVRGEIQEVGRNEFSLRSAGGDLFRFVFDQRTWIERSRERIPGAALRRGELLEVVSDRGGEAPQYARLVHVMERAVQKPVVHEGHYRLFGGLKELPPALEYVGVVVSRQGQTLTLRTRLDGIKQFIIRTDTRCLEDGSQVKFETLEAQTHVEVRAGKNADGDLDAYEIIWGILLNPR